MTLEEALKFVAAHPNREEAIKGLKEHAGGLHQEIHQAGFNVGYGKNAGDLATAQGKVTELTAQVGTLTTERDAARQTNPDVAKLHSDYKKQLDDKDTAHAAAIAKANGVVSSTSLSRTQKDLIAELVSQGVKRVHAEAMVERKAISDRMKPDPATGEVQFYQAGTQIPLVSANDKTPLQLIAAELRATASADMLGSSADAGAGGGNGNLPPGPANEFQKIRDRVKAEGEQTGDVKPHGAFHRMATTTP